MDTPAPSPAPPRFHFHPVTILQQFLEEQATPPRPAMVRLFMVGRPSALEGNLVSASGGFVELEVNGSRQFIDPARIEAITVVDARHRR